MELTASRAIARYKQNGSPGTGRDMIDSDERYFLRETKASWHAEVQVIPLTLPASLRAWKNGRLPSANLDMKSRRDVRHPLRDWICLILEGEGISKKGYCLFRVSFYASAADHVT